MSFPTSSGFFVHICSSLFWRSPQILSGSLWLLQASFWLWAPGAPGCTGEWRSCGLRFQSGWLCLLPWETRGSLEESRGGGLSLHLALWSSPRPASLLFTGLFCSVQSLFHVVALFFPVFLFDTPFDDIFFDCSEGEGVGGKAWLLGGTSTCGKPKVKHIPFLVLEPLSPTPTCAQAAGLVAMEAVKS